MTKLGSTALHRLQVCTAWFSTHTPTGTMRPLFSSSGMNSSGGTLPYSGAGPARQRLRAAHAPGRRIDLRLVRQAEPFEPMLHAVAQKLHQLERARSGPS